MKRSLPDFDFLQKISMSIMVVLVILTFVVSNLHAVLWQNSDWLVSTVLPAVVVDLTNDERADNELQPLRRNPTLDAAAKLKAEHMAKNEYFSHFSPSGVSPWYWFDESGYVYAHAGENLAIHFTDSDEVVEAWMGSPSHRQNIVDKKYTEIGVATFKGKFEGYDTVYVVQLFGTPAIAPIENTEPVETAVLAEADTLVVEPVVEKIALALKTEAESIETEVPIVLAVEEPVKEVAVIKEVEPVVEVETESVIAVENEVTVFESSTIATSSGLAVANITTDNSESPKSSIAAIATQPNTLLQIVYLVLAVAVVILLLSSIVFEAKHLHFAQASYAVVLLMVMSGLWYFHSLLTSGAVIV
jgi:Cysteine-rich secretory protein family